MKTLQLVARLSTRRSAAASKAAASFHSSSLLLKKEDAKNWADPVARQYKFWNREADAGSSGKYSFLIEMSPESIQQEAKIISLSEPDDPANESLHKGTLPLGATLLGVGTALTDFENVKETPNVLFVSPSCPRAAVMLPLVLAAYPSIRWVHCRSAGIDFVESDEFSATARDKEITVTNAKGQFSSSLAEYAFMACSYFAKDLPRLMRQKVGLELRQGVSI